MLIMHGLSNGNAFSGDRTNPLDSYSDNYMHKYYGFTWNGVMHAIDLLEPHPRPQTQCSQATDANTQVFVAFFFFFFTTGCFFYLSGTSWYFRSKCVCRIVHRVLDVLVGLKDDHVKWHKSHSIWISGSYQSSWLYTYASRLLPIWPKLGCLCELQRSA